jgi:hypothetical protein
MTGRVMKTPPPMLLVADYTCAQTGTPLLLAGRVNRDWNIERGSLQKNCYR